MTDAAYEVDVRTLTTYEAYCSCGWSTVRWKQSDADKAADAHGDRHDAKPETEAGR